MTLLQEAQYSQWRRQTKHTGMDRELPGGPGAEPPGHLRQPRPPEAQRM